MVKFDVYKELAATAISEFIANKWVRSDYNFIDKQTYMARINSGLISWVLPQYREWAYDQSTENHFKIDFSLIGNRTSKL